MFVSVLSVIYLYCREMRDIVHVSNFLFPCSTHSLEAID